MQSTASALHGQPEATVLLRHRFPADRTFRTDVRLRTESRARCGEGRGESASTCEYVLHSRVVGESNGQATVECLVHVARPEDEERHLLLQGERHLITVTPRGEVVGTDAAGILPGAWFALPGGYATPGTTWRGHARPFQFTCGVIVYYTFEKLESRGGRRLAHITWNCPAVTHPDGQGARREFRAWGTYVMDVDAGTLVSAQNVTRTRHMGPGWENESIAQLDLTYDTL